MIVKQCDNIGTVGWRNIWGLFTIDQLAILTQTIPTNHISNTFHAKNFNVNSIERLTRYASQCKNPMKQWAYYFDYPKQYHKQVWDILNQF